MDSSTPADLHSLTSTQKEQLIEQMKQEVALATTQALLQVDDLPVSKENLEHVRYLFQKMCLQTRNEFGSLWTGMLWLISDYLDNWIEMRRYLYGSLCGLVESGF